MAGNDVGEMLARKVEKDLGFIIGLRDESYPNGGVQVGGSIVLHNLPKDNIMILEDEFKSSYDCKKCGGRGKNRFDTPCPDCNGRGALVHIPDEAKARPTSGVILAIGPEVDTYKIGDKVCYSGYTGHLLPFKDNTRIRIMRQTEPFCQVSSLKSPLDGAIKIEFIDKDTAYDLT